MTKDDLLQLNSRYVKLLALIRTQAVNIVDSFDLRDEVLGSALGCWDGNVYQSIVPESIKVVLSFMFNLAFTGLFDEAAKSPLNQSNVHESFHKYLKPLLKSNL